jgi:hypothetical protein
VIGEEKKYLEKICPSATNPGGRSGKSAINRMGYERPYMRVAGEVAGSSSREWDV